MRVNYEMTAADLSALLDAMKPVPMIMLQCGAPRSVQENANAAWARLGEKMGFDPMTVQPNGRGDRFFSADALAAQEKTGDKAMTHMPPLPKAPGMVLDWTSAEEKVIHAYARDYTADQTQHWASLSAMQVEQLARAGKRIEALTGERNALDKQSRDIVAGYERQGAELDKIADERDKLLRLLNYLTEAARPFHGRADDCGQLARKILESKP